MNSIKKIVGAVSIGMVGMTSTFAALDLTTDGSFGEINGALFQQVTLDPTGTGVIDPFLRLSPTQNNDWEAAYNTSANLGAPFGQHGGAGQHNEDLLLSAVGTITVNGTSYYQFLLDLDEPQSGENSLITLNQVQIYRTSTPSQTGGTVDTTTGRFVDAGFTGTLVYDLNPGGGTANSVVMDSGLASGSGSGGVLMYVPVDAVAGASGDYLVLYSHLGRPPGAYAADAGFEEWATLTGDGDIGIPPIPEPATVIAGSLLAIPFAASLLARRRLRR